MRLSTIAPAVFLSLAAASAQTPDLPREFEVASIHAAKPGGQHGVWTDGSPTQIRMLGLNLKELDVEGYRLVAQGPEYAEPYDIFAKVPADVAKLPDKERWGQIHLMTQSLLATCFKLTFHNGSQERQLYTLSPAKGGTKIKQTGPTRQENVITDRRPGHLAAHDMPMSQLVDILHGEVKRPVLDETGVKGIFDISLDWAPEQLDAKPESAMADPRPSLTDALEQALGLKLVSGKRSIDVMIVDHAEKPSEN